MRRPKVRANTPLHITLRLKKRIPSLRNRKLLRLFRQSLHMSRPFGMRVIHFSLLSNHIHMIAEAPDNTALAQGMRSLGGRFGRIVRRSISVKSRGPVFAGRYHLRLIETPRQMRNALEYVLLNQAKHLKFIEHLDPYSSASTFLEWRKLLGVRFSSLVRAQAEEIQDANRFGLSPPRSWLGRKGWMSAC